MGNCLALLDAQQPFMVKAGCSRLQLLLRLEAARERAAGEGAAPRLLALLRRRELLEADAGAPAGGRDGNGAGQLAPTEARLVWRSQQTARGCSAPLPGASTRVRSGGAVFCTACWEPASPPLAAPPAAAAGVAEYALATLEALAASPAGLAAVAEAGGSAELAAFVAATQRSPQTEDALFRAQRLLAALQARDAGEPAAAAAQGAAVR